MISLETLIGLLTFLCINILFFRQVYIIFKNKITSGYLYISLILFEIVAIIINQVIIRKEKRKLILENEEKEMQNNQEDEDLNDLILKLEKEETKEK